MLLLVFFLVFTVTGSCQQGSPPKLHLLNKHENSEMRGMFLHDAGTLNDTTAECNIDTYNGLSMKKFRIIGADDSTFTVLKDDVARTLPVSDLRKLAFIKHGFWKGFAWGSLGTLGLTGILFAALAGSVHGEDGLGLAILLYGGILISAPVGVVVGLISEFVTNDEVYYFDRINNDARVKRLKYLILKYKD